MPYVFRKYAGADENGTKCWSPNKPIDADSFVNENIVITKGTSKAGTSIPSPLARLELFDTAFKIVASDKSNLKGNSIYHQLVSDCLDVLQLLFNIKNEDVGFGKKIWFKEWKVRENIDKLKAKGESHPNYLLGKSLQQIFFDKTDTGFSTVDSIFLIYYETKLLGGTSPLTLVFTSPNWSRYVREGEIRNIPQSADGDVFFDSDYRALFERDKEFIKYLYKLTLYSPEAFLKAKSIRSYINKTIELKYSWWKEELINAKNKNGDANAMDEEYSKLLTNIENKYLTANGMFFYHQKEGKELEKIQSVSDFLIRTSVTKYSTQINEKGETKTVFPPLVLVDGMNYSGDYTEMNVPWNSNTKVLSRYHRFVPLYERELPQGNSQSAKYPFVTTDDFLDDFLIELPFNINRSKFVSGYKGDFKYLLPVKKEYFNFFTLADLKNYLSITPDEGEIKVKLKVPVRNKKGVPDILFSKTYSRQKGTVVECRADIGIYPFYQVTDSNNHNYTVLLANLVERDKNKEQLALHFHSFKNFASDDTRLESNPIVRSVYDTPSSATSKFYRLKTSFDYIEMMYHAEDGGNVYSGLIIPDFTNRTYNKGNLIKSFTFALDFGTSNTHIAWMEKDEALPKPFEIEPADQQMVLLHEPTASNDLEFKYANYGRIPQMDLVLRREFIPPVITPKDNAAIAFPFKTASCEVIEFNNIETSKRDLFSHINIGYYIDKEETRGNVIYTTNLKWLLENSNDDSNKSRVKFFLQQLFWQIKAKAILNNGKPADLKIVWSVPLSMAKGNKTTLSAVLKEAFKAVFSDSGATLQEPIPESVAPYFYLTKSGSGIQDIANTVNIDIGGGTADVMMFMESAGADRNDKYVTSSFRFAGNDLWGSGYKGKLKDNGFIKNYLIYQKVNNINPEEAKYFNKGKEDGNLNADDVISLLFKYDNKFKFSDSITIGNPNLSLVLYLHFAAIVYHIIQIIEAKDYPMPRYLSFTGKGSQYIKLLCGGDEQELEAFTKLLIQVYTDLPIQSSFKIHLNTNPKEITANGAVLYSLADTNEKKKYDDAIQFVHPGFDPVIYKDLGERLADDATQGFIIDETLQINSVLNVSVLNNINHFLEKTLTNRSIIEYLNDFKVKNLNSAYNVLRWNGNIDNGEGFVYDSYRKVLNNLKYDDKDNRLPESLFFFGFKDALYQLSKFITDTKN